MQFLLMRRVTEPLNAALAAISLVHLDSAADKPREYWQERSTGEVLGVLNLVNAWHALLRYKLGELLPEQHIRPFQVQDLLDWVSYQLELTNPLRAEKNLMVEASQESLQEALLLLYSAVYTLGPNVHLVVQNIDNGVWFRVRYARTGKGCPASLDDLLEQLDGNWRLEDTAFELRTAADFITLSGSQLHLQGTEQFCEMAFFVYAVGKRPPEPLKRTEISEPPPITASAEEAILSSIAAITDDATKPLPPATRAALSRPTPAATAGTEPPNEAGGRASGLPTDNTSPDLVAGSPADSPDEAGVAAHSTPEGIASKPQAETALGEVDTGEAASTAEGIATPTGDDQPAAGSPQASSDSAADGTGLDTGPDTGPSLPEAPDSTSPKPSSTAS